MSEEATASGQANVGSGGCIRAARPARGSVSLVIILGGLSAFAPFAIDMYLPAFTRISADLGTSIGSVQLTLSVFLAGLAVGQFLWGTLSDHLGRRLPILLGCAGFVAAAVVCGLTRSLPVLVAARFLMGFGGSAGVVVSRAVVRDMFDEHESARFYAMMMIIGGLAPIIAPTLGGLLLTWWSWRAIFAVVAMFGSLCILGVFWTVPETLPRHLRATENVRGVLAKYWGLIRNWRFSRYALGIGFGYSTLFAYISSSPFLFMHLYGISPQRYSLFFMTNAAGIYCVGQSNRLLLRRLTPGDILGRATLLNLAAGLVLLVAGTTGVGGFPLLFAMLFVLIASMGWIFPNAIAVAMKPVPDQAGCASALLGVAQFTFGATAASLVGSLTRHTAIPAVSVIAASSLCSWLTIRGGNHPQAEARVRA